MKYRSDIDGLRAIAVLAVILFHSGLSFLPGGFIGVDVFFVISGYLITTLVYNDVKKQQFSFFSFYKRRAVRLLPALTMTLLLVFLFGFVFYSNALFDNLGKELFFSSIGAANILFAQGINYFAKNEAYQPLIHLWSLGVEEQFYVVWPIILLFAFRLSSKSVIPVAILLFCVSLFLSIRSVDQGLTEGYFLVQYRAFELLVGVITALLMVDRYNNPDGGWKQQALSYIGFSLIVLPMFILSKDSSFPGFNALLPTLGTALVIAFPSKGLITSTLSNKLFVFIGLLSYPLYLYHQPIISFLAFFQVGLPPMGVFFWVTFIAIILAWLTYKFIELPIRRVVFGENKKKSHVTLFSLILTIPLFAIAGIGVAKSEGFGERFKILNPFALEVGKAHELSFHHDFERGYKVSNSPHGKVLFLGDSVLQQYVTPISKMLGLERNQVDTVTRGGCMLLKGVEFKDIFSDISCNELREKIYLSKKTYDYVFVSQAWELKSYGTSVTNFDDEKKGNFNRWEPFLRRTIEHFSKHSEKVVVIGAHPRVVGTNKLQPSIMVSKPKFLSDLNQIKVTNVERLKESLSFFKQYEALDFVQVISPYNIFCKESACVTNNGKWSFFGDNQHISNASTDFMIDRLKILYRYEL